MVDDIDVVELSLLEILAMSYAESREQRKAHTSSPKEESVSTTSASKATGSASGCVCVQHISKYKIAKCPDLGLTTRYIDSQQQLAARLGWILMWTFLQVVIQ